MNETRKFDAHVDATQVRNRLSKASQRLQSLLWKCTIVDVSVIAIWLFTAIAPLIGNGVLIRNSKSPASVAFLFIICALAPVCVSLWRTALVIKIEPRRVRVDMIVNAPTTFRQIAYVTHHSYLGWWFWLGYVSTTVYLLSNVFFVLIWILVFGFGFLASLFLILETFISAAALMGCTFSLYEKGIQSNFTQNVAFSQDQNNQWARFRANEERRKWKLLNER